MKSKGIQYFMIFLCLGSLVILSGAVFSNTSIINGAISYDVFGLFTSNDKSVMPINNLSVNSTSFILNGTIIYDWSDFGFYNDTTYPNTAEVWITTLGNLDNVDEAQFKTSGTTLQIRENFIADTVDAIYNFTDYWRKDGVGSPTAIWDLGIYGIISQSSYFESITMGTPASPKSYIGNDGDVLYVQADTDDWGTFLIKESDLDVDGELKLNEYTTDGFLKTSGSDGTVIVDSTNYYPYANPLNFINTTYVYNDTWINNTFYNKSYIDGLNYANVSFNQTLTDSLYYLKSNPANYINGSYFDDSIYSDYGYFKTLEAGFSDSNSIYNYKLNGTSIYQSIVSEYNVTGSITPNLTGVYVYNGTFNGKPAYSERTGRGWLYFETESGLGSYALSEVLGNATAYFFADSFLTNPPINDSYTAWGDYTGGGTAIVSILVEGGWEDIQSKWDEAYSWGDHSTQGYLTAESDPAYYSNPYGYINTSSEYFAGSNLTLSSNIFALNTTSVLSWLETIFVKITDVVGMVGNWSADKVNYYNKTEVYNQSEVYTQSEVNSLVPSTDIDSGLISWWRMDDGSLTQIYDYTGNHNGTITGATYTDNGMIGLGMSFDGNDRIDIPASTDYDVQRLTIAFWVYSSNYGGPGGGNGMFIFEKGYINTQYSFFFNPSLFGGGPVFRTYNSAGVSNDLNVNQATAGMVNGNWYYITAVYDGSYKYIYIDGEQITNVSYTQTLKTGLGTSQRIGAYNHATTPGYYFNGIIDELQVYNRGLSATEVMELYQKNSLIKTNLTMTKDIFADRYIVNGSNGWSGNCGNVSVSNGIIVGCND